MRILFLNLPNAKRMVRRYSCSYMARGFLYPPLELLRPASIVKQKGKHEIFFLDAIAKGLDEKSVASYMDSRAIDVVVTLIGFECSDDDMDVVRRLKKGRDIKVVGIGYIPFRFKEEFRELDVILDDLFEQRVALASPEEDFIAGLKRTFKKRVDFDPDVLDKTDLRLISHSDYSEIFCGGPTGFLYRAFGCPFRCTYCIRSYDQKSYTRETQTKCLTRSGICTIMGIRT